MSIQSDIKLFMQIKKSLKNLSMLIMIVAACSQTPQPNEQEQDDRVSVFVTIIKAQKFTEKSIYFGKLESMQYADLICYSGGRVEKINVNEGDSVKKGQSLAQIDGSRASTLLQTARVQRNLARSTLDQTIKHLENGNASQLAVDQQNLSYLNAQNSFIDAQKNYRSAFAITPISGVVTRKYIDLFQELTTNKITFTVSKNDTIKIKIGITESDIYHVNIGSETILTIPMIPEKSWIGKVNNLAGAADRDDRVFSAEAFFDNRYGYLKPGTSGMVQVSLLTYDSAIVIPTEAIINEGVQSSVMVVDSSGVVHRKIIVPGSSTNNCTMVKRGLNVGDRLITAGFQLVREGMKVIVKKSGDYL